MLFLSQNLSFSLLNMFGSHTSYCFFFGECVCVWVPWCWASKLRGRWNWKNPLSCRGRCIHTTYILSNNKFHTVACECANARALAHLYTFRCECDTLVLTATIWMSTFIVNVDFILYFVVHFNECIRAVYVYMQRCSSFSDIVCMRHGECARIPLICCGHFTRVFSTFSWRKRRKREKEKSSNPSNAIHAVWENKVESDVNRLMCGAQVLHVKARDQTADQQQRTFTLRWAEKAK